MSDYSKTKSLVITIPNKDAGKVNERSVLQSLRDNSPVRSGQYRDSWQVNVSTINKTSTMTTKTVTMHNPLPYATRIEDEMWSNQSPGGAILPTEIEIHETVLKSWEK